MASSPWGEVTIGLVALACAFAYAAWRYAPVAEAAVQAYVTTHTPVAKPEQKPTVAIPRSIMQFVYSHNEDWAQEQVKARALELFETLNDWGMVAHQLEREGNTE